jgi:hypothetical protein
MRHLIKKDTPTTPNTEKVTSTLAFNTRFVLFIAAKNFLKILNLLV